MAAAGEQVSDELWDDFHQVVNMTSRELQEWLNVRHADEEVEALPDQAGTETGQHVLAILGKRRTDLTPDDAAVMERVVRRVRTERATTSSPPPASRPGGTGS